MLSGSGSDDPNAANGLPAQSARPSFDRQLAALQGAVMTLGEMVDKAIYGRRTPWNGAT